MTASYDSNGLSFQFPENWELTEDPPSEGTRCVSVTSRSGAFWSVAVYEARHAADELCRQVLDAMQKEYDEIEVDSVSEEIADESAVGYDLQFYCLDFLVRCKVLAVEGTERTLLLTWQAEDREFDNLEAVFYAITTSLLRTASGHN